MPRARKNKEEEVEAVEGETVESIDEAVEAQAAEWPVVAGSGKFQSVAFDDGFVVYNPNGQRVTGIIGDAEAKDLVNRHNIAGGFK